MKGGDLQDGWFVDIVMLVAEGFDSVWLVIVKGE